MNLAHPHSSDEQAFGGLFSGRAVKGFKRIMKKLIVIFLLLGSLCAEGLEEKLKQELPRLGHRNWIVIADAAYPQQVAPGVETMVVSREMLATVEKVITEIGKTRNLRPVIFTDLEMRYVSEKNAPGITAYREGLAKILANQTVQSLPHEELIGKLDEAGKTFKILLIKTPMDKPYTSVFIRLECGYWNEASEKELRKAMKQL